MFIIDPWKLLMIQTGENIFNCSHPPVVAVSVQQALGVTVQRLDLVVCIVALLRVIKANKEGCLLYGIQRLLVFAIFEELLSSLCPRGPKEAKQKIWF